MTPVPVTLASAAACAIVNIWLGSRIAAYRKAFAVSVGDGGHEPLLRRMRAQANFVEHAPFVLILLAGLELSGSNRIALAIFAGVFIIARVLHGLGMDGGDRKRFRMYGMITSSLVTVTLTVWAILCVLGSA